jgi:hypothetical protein
MRFPAAPEGPFAPDALLKLGRGWAAGQVQEACVTLGEVGHPVSRQHRGDAGLCVAMQDLGCQ